MPETSPQVVSAPPRKRGPWLLGYVLLVLVALPITIYVVLWIYHLLVSMLNVAAPVVAVPLVALLLALIGPWLLITNEIKIRAALAGAVRKVYNAFARTALAKALAHRFPRLAALIKRLFSSSPSAGLLLIAVVLVASAVVWFFIVLLIQVVTGAAITGTDTRIINLVATLRTPEADTVFYAFTLCGTAEVLVLVSAVGILFTLLLARYEDALMIFLALAAGTAFFVLVKLFVQRPRPPLEDARYVQSGFSFPSGHSTVSAALYGTMAYLIIRAVKSQRLKVLIGIIAALLVFAIGLSRVYLGVHYPSDVLAGWAAGIFWVLLAVAGEDIWPSRKTKPLPGAWRVADGVTALALFALGGVYLGMNFGHVPPSPNITPPPPQIIAPDAVPSTLATSLPHYTEGLFGEPQEPVNVVFVGTRAQIEAAFRGGGWTEAEPFGFGSVIHAFVAGATGRPDRAGPVTPSFLGDEPNELAFELPLGTTFAQRHHIRLWTTRVETSDGQPIWEATASLDEGFELAPNNGFPTHHIAPNIDEERAFVITTLENSGDVSGLTLVRLVPPETGHNFAGDSFTTDGQSAILTLSQTAA